MSLKREEEPQAVAVVKEDGRKGALEQEGTEDVQLGQRRRVARGGKMRLRGKLGGQRRQNSEKKNAEKEAKKQERRELVLALKLNRAESRKAQKEEARSESKNSESETKRGRFSRKDKERKASKSRSLSRKVSRSSSKPKSSEGRHLKVKKSRSESSKPNKKEKEPRFFKNRRDASENTRKETDPKGISKLKLTVEEKMAKRQARKEMREAKKAEAAEIKITGYISQEEPQKKRRNQFLSFSNVPRNPFFPKIRYGKIVHVPKAIRSMRAAAQRR
ncbi:hypothetical protein CAEBREN_24488 [Caenorhabditis brenneri]|uniref:Uncharacterized protein n=1 Tax=Caenorhabditis brenneri TaxID=135651 RepID=G0N6G1_CAEBE|nr:hypothetical protein CAEBREN_24488 [Caenorhabditis brenneri]